MELKPFQQEALDLLRRYLEAARVQGPEAPFAALAAEGNAGYPPMPYHAVPGLESVPYVCLRLPTGGGKTFLASEAVGVVARALLEREYPVVLWLVPTKTIRAQTVEALKKPGHPYRKQMDIRFRGRVGIYDLSEFAQIRPQDLTEQACIVVATIQSFRVRDTEGRKIYDHSEAFETHFARVDPATPGLEQNAPESGRTGPKYSFVNLLFLHRPLVIVDEAHNARGELSYNLLRAVNPASIVEFTATPKLDGEYPSNVLYRVAADRVKAADMIKLPVNLTEFRSDWRAAVARAVEWRKQLLDLAADEPDFVRPIALFQAQSAEREVTVEVLKQHLIDHERVPAERIAVATGDQRGLDGIDLFDPNCPIDHVITVQALKEGWDCPFAYVFCSVADVQSQTAVEQLLGRVLRMPYARKRKAEALNQAYAFVSSDRFGTAAGALRDKMVEGMGFERDQAAFAVVAAPPEGLFGDRLREGATPGPVLGHYELDGEPDLSAVEPAARANISVQVIGGRAVVTVTGDVPVATETAIVAAAAPGDRPRLREEIRVQRLRHARSIAPVHRGERIEVPAFRLRLDDALELPEREGFLHLGGWRLTDHPATLDAREFAVGEVGERFVIDLAGQRIEVRHTDQQKQIDLGALRLGWTEGELIRWLDSQIKALDLAQADKLEFCRRAVEHLVAARGLTLETLVRFKFPLLQAVSRKIESHRAAAAERSFQQSLFGNDPALVLSFDPAHAFTFDRARGYGFSNTYSGPFAFSKPFYGVTGDLAATGEEFECARWIDASPQVKHWFRNISGRPDQSFWLPTSTDRFYPDFVAELMDGRILVVEYKGAHILDSADTREKANIGAAFEEQSKGRALFLMAVARDANGRDVRQQITAKIDGTY